MAETDSLLIQDSDGEEGESQSQKKDRITEAMKAIIQHRMDSRPKWYITWEQQQNGTATQHGDREGS